MADITIAQSNPNDDERRHQQSISEIVKQTFRKINFNRVFHCKSCSKVWLGKDLEKTHDGKYTCRHCNHEVVDVTATPLGVSFLNIVLPEWKARKDGES